MRHHSTLSAKEAIPFPLLGSVPCWSMKGGLPVSQQQAPRLRLPGPSLGSCNQIFPGDLLTSSKQKQGQVVRLCGCDYLSLPEEKRKRKNQ